MESPCGEMHAHTAWLAFAAVPSKPSNMERPARGSPVTGVRILMIDIIHPQPSGEGYLAIQLNTIYNSIDILGNNQENCYEIQQLRTQTR